MNLKKTQSHLTAILFLLLSAVACSEKDEPAVTSIEGIEVPESTLKSGGMPGTSSDPGAPEIESSITDLITVPGGQLVIQTSVLSGEAAGFYLGIDGHDAHFDITSVNPPINGRTKSDFPYFIIRFLESFPPQEVCIQYAVYDNTGRVSNKISRCIQVKTAGGANSGFLTANAWQAVSFHEVLVEQGIDDEKYVGETYTEERSVGINCAGGIPSNVTVEEKSRTNHEYLTIATNGSVDKEENFYYKVFDPNSNCTPSFLEATETQASDGIWIYESENSKLYLVLTSDAEGTVTYTYETTSGGGTLVLKEDHGNGDYLETVYAPKN